MTEGIGAVNNNQGPDQVVDQMIYSLFWNQLQQASNQITEAMQPDPDDPNADQ